MPSSGQITNTATGTTTISIKLVGVPNLMSSPLVNCLEL